MKSLLLALAFISLIASHAAAWGPEGHKAIAEAAQGALTPAAAKAIAKIFGNSPDLAPGALADVATWPDDLRQHFGTGWDDNDKREADLFNKAWPKNAEW